MTQALSNNDLEVELRAKIPREMLWETKKWRINVNSFYSRWYGRIPFIRSFMVHLEVLYLGLFTNDVIIFHELSFFRQIVFFKKIFPNKRVIHYCTELYTKEDFPKHTRLLKFYEKHANVPDLIIESDYGREKLRKKMYSITKPTVVIPNTIPKEEIPEKGQRGTLAKLAGLVTFPENIPIVIYTGGGYLHRQLDMIVEAISMINKEVFFLAFVYGDKKGFDQLNKVCEEKLNSKHFKICEAVPRNDLLQCINEATAGIVYYKPSLSIGNLYAAPTKLFEYIGANIPVVSSNNPEIVKLFNKFDLGKCVEDETLESLSKTINDLIFNDHKISLIKENQKTVFETSLCYEVASKEAIYKIIDLVK